jgi:hypothetical protein
VRNGADILLEEINQSGMFKLKGLLRM